MERIQLTTLEESGAERRERADAAANRALILQTAERLFAERGVAAVCMAEIAEAAGVGKGTLYRRFANKAELCLSLMDRQMGEFQNDMLARFQGQNAAGLSHLEQLAQFLEALVSFTERHSPLLLEVERGGLSEERLNLPHFWQFMTVGALLNAAARKGELVSDLDLEYLGEALLAPLQVDIFRFQRDVRGYSLDRISAGLRSLVERLADRD
ncbi:TetR/AcrR family transcriptional regulator [Promineifilum sp.]|uniref:TetR/AcrR family transcriptional regulator n=1 Tax=Promineifilum sp. TaxID=2664178 RepID=UPI0035B1A9CF